ncbi:hypothetical protein B0H10DRAFT_1954400 [Mycena sp. CBHHK59/15]|nr:hypothetical protein B0H10DRAFT_1954400 [Mycena sp. CBHHK59/15]
MYPGSGGFSPAVRNLSSGALDYWIECNLASCIEFMYPGSAGLIATPVEPSSATLEYCSEHNLASCVNSMYPGPGLSRESLDWERLSATRMRIWAWTIYGLNDSNKEGQRNFKGNFQKVRCWSTFNDSSLGGEESQGLLVIGGCKLASSADLTDAQFGLTLRLHGKKVPRIKIVWTGTRGPGNLRTCDLCLSFGGLRSWFDNLHCGHGLSGCDLCLGSGGLRSWTEAATSVWASGGVGVVAWQAATSVWHQGASGSSPGKLRPLFGFWGWTSWPGKLRLLFGFGGTD